MVYLGPVERRELIKVLDQLVAPLLVKNDAHGSSAERGWAKGADWLYLAPLERKEIESLQIVEILHTRVESAVHNHPVAKDGTTVVPPTSCNSVKILLFRIVPLVRLQVKHEDVGMDRAHISASSP